MSNQSKIATLFSFISQNKDLPLTTIFDKFSKKWKLGRDSVRNIYYQNFEKVCKDSSFCAQNNVIVSNLKKSEINTFNDEEKERLVKEVLILLKEGHSVRSSCLKIANGDASKMVRYLNKYRTILKKEPEFIKDISIKYNIYDNSYINEKSQKRVPIKKLNNSTVFKPEKKGSINDSLNNKSLKTGDKLIEMPIKPDFLSDKDIQSLFMGLVRLVKNNTFKEVDYVFNEKYKEQIFEILTLKKSLKLVKSALEEEKLISNKLRVELNIIKKGKMEDYIKFMKNLKINKENVKIN